jgi:hypothetical protein
VKEFLINLFIDGMNVDRVGNDYRLLNREIAEGDALEIDLAPGGGVAINWKNSKKESQSSYKAYGQSTHSC